MNVDLWLIVDTSFCDRKLIYITHLSFLHCTQFTIRKSRMNISTEICILSVIYKLYINRYNRPIQEKVSVSIISCKKIESEVCLLIH